MKSIYYMLLTCLVIFNLQVGALAQTHRSIASQTAPPLIVMDGKVLQTGSISDNRWLPDVQPAHIESIEVLKGANAAAKFGALGANGVILITTKNTIDVVKEVLKYAGNTERPLFLIDGQVSSATEIKLTSEEIQHIYVFKGEKAIQKHGEQAKHGAIEITTQASQSKITAAKLLTDFDEKEQPLFVVDGKILTKALDLEPEEIKSVMVLKGKAAKKKYGKKGKNGVVEITTKNKVEE